MDVQIKDTAGMERTDTPRALTPREMSQIQGMSHLEAVKLHRRWTHSTLRAAVREVDAVHAATDGSGHGIDTGESFAAGWTGKTALREFLRQALEDVNND